MTPVNPHPEILFYTRIRKSPFFHASRKHGVAMYSVINHQYHPRHYGDPFQEYWDLLNGVTLWDVGGERQVEITGPEAFEFTNMLTPRDLTKCDVGQCKYTFITTPDGGILNDPVLLRLDENHFWLSAAEDTVLPWAIAMAYNSGLNVNIHEADVGPVQVQGPKSKEVITDLFGEDILEVPYYYVVHKELNGMDVVVSRTGYSGELGYEIYVKNASRDGEKLWGTVWEAGQPHGLVPIGPCHIRRIEGGILAYYADMWLDNNPYEVGYGYKWMVEFDQEADFVGKEALRKIKEKGVKRKLVGVEIGGERLGAYIDGSMIDFFPVYDEGRHIGKVTSACYSPRLDKNIGFAMVPIEYSDLGTEFEVETPTGRGPAAVVEKPFIKPDKAEQELRPSTAS